MKRGITAALLFLYVLIFTAFADELRTLERDERLALIDQITAVLREGGNLHAKDAQGRPTLYLAALAEDARIVAILLEAGVPVDQTDKDGYTALHVAALTGNVDIARLLLAGGAALDALGDEDRTPLFIAARENRAAVVRLLLEKGANPLLPKEGGWTPLHTAAGQNAVAALTAFRDAGIPVNTLNPQNGWTSLHVAAQQGRLDACRYLLDQGANPDARTICRCTPLMYAAEYSRAEIIDLLCSKGADVQVYNCKGFTPLLLAVEKNVLNPVSVLLSHNADVNAVAPDGLNAINLAVRNNNASMLGLLVSRGLDPSRPNGKGESPLYDALAQFRSGPVEMGTLEALVALGSDINIPTMRDNWSPLYVARRFNNRDTSTAAFLKKHNALNEPYYLEPPAWIPESFITKDTWDNPTVEFTPAFKEFLEDYFDKGGDWNVTDEAGNTLLHWFAEKDYAKGMRRLLEAGMPVDVRNRLGCTPLIRVATVNADDSTMRLLIDAGADVEAYDFVGNRALHYAAFRGHRATVSILLQSKAVPDAPNRFGVTPLHNVCLRSALSHRDVAAALLAAGASPDVLDYAGQSPLHIVSANTFEMIDIIQTMIRQGAPVNQPDAMGVYPLHKAIHSERVVLALIQNGATVDVVDRLGRTPLFYAIEKNKSDVAKVLIDVGADFEMKNYTSGATALHYAVFYRDAKTVELLLSKGADAAARTREGQTPLDIAKANNQTALVKLFEKALEIETPDYDPQKAAELAARERQRAQIASREQTRMFWLYREPGPLFTAVLESNSDTVRKAVADGAQFDEQLNVDNVNIYTPLHGAVYFEDEPMVRLLVELGADLNIPRPNHGGRPLHVAAMNRSLPMTRLLAELGADLRAADDSGDSPFRRAVIHGASDVIRFYLNNGFDINEKDNRGWTALHMAAYNHGPVQLLLSLGADVNAQDNSGDTPLHNAMTLYEKKETIDLLLAAGADINALNRSSRTPLIAALIVGQFNNARWLIEAGADVNIGKDYSQGPALFAAGGELELVLMMVERGADINATGGEGQTVLHVLVSSTQAGTYDLQTLEYYLEQGLDVNVADNDKRTPLYRAIEGKRYDMLKFLIEHGADVNVEDTWLTRPIEYAYSRNDIAAMKILLEHGAIADPEHEKNRKSRYATPPGRPSFEEAVRQLSR